jgi:PIN domain nuclease of toxin-antitoxin system
LAVAALPMHHRDPFDRLLIAQAQVESLPILTADRAFDAYDVETMAA